MRLFPLTLFWSIIECQWILILALCYQKHATFVRLKLPSRLAQDGPYLTMSGRPPVWTSFLHRLPSGFHGFPQSTRAGILSWIRILLLPIDFTISLHGCIVWVKCQRRKYEQLKVMWLHGVEAAIRQLCLKPGLWNFVWKDVEEYGSSVKVVFVGDKQGVLALLVKTVYVGVDF